MSTNVYQMWLMRDQGKEKIPIPILPESYDLKLGNTVSSVSIIELGEAIAYKSPNAMQLTISSILPNPQDPSIEWYVAGAYRDMSAKAYFEALRKFLDSRKILQVIIIGSPVNMFCRCSEFSIQEGKEYNVGEIAYTMTLTEHRETSTETVNVNPSTNMAELPSVEPRRLDTRIDPLTLISEPGDTLTSIVRRLQGSGTNPSQIYADNVDVLKNPCLLEPGTVLRIPQ